MAQPNSSKSTEISEEEQQGGCSSSASSAPHSLVGGNLTIAGSLSEQSSASRETPTTGGGGRVSREQQIELSREESANEEEYQMARVDIPDEDGEDEDELVSNSQVTTVKIESKREERQRNGELPRPSQIAVRPPQAAPHSMARTHSSSPNLGALASPKANAPQAHQPPQQRQLLRLAAAGGAVVGSPALERRRSSADNLSLSSVSLAGQRRPLASSQGGHFEIRWQNLRLSARRSKSRVPQALAENFIYKALFGSSDSVSLAADSEKFERGTCYSPPVQNKIPPTILERDEKQFDENNEHDDTANGAIELDAASRAISDRKRRRLSAEFASDEATRQPGRARTILSNISGSVFSSQLTAILGPSGVGKTTLLNSLTGRNTLEGSGRVCLLGATNKLSKRMAVVTVPQNDILPEKLTTLEDLQFTSRLKNPQKNFDHTRNIERIVKHLQMSKFLNTRIEKLSGGEQRRLSIARELLSSPDIMILDEPTSGLDANTCKKIIVALRDIVEHSENILERPMSIIVTIHQPQQEVYNLFHRVYVMALGGKVVYEGPPQMLLPTLLEQSSLSRVCQLDQLNENPAIVALELASGEYGLEIIDELNNLHEIFAHEDENQYDGLTLMGQSPAATPRVLGGGGRGTPTSLRAMPRVASSPRLDSASSFLHRKRQANLGSLENTPVLGKRINLSSNQLDKMSAITSVSYASTWDAELPQEVSGATRLKVDKRLRRSVVMKSSFLSHTWTLMKRCWLLTTRDIFLMSIRIIGFLLVAGGTVQIFSHALDGNEHICPNYESQIDDMGGYLNSMQTRMGNILTLLNQSNSHHMFLFHITLCVTMVTSALAGLVFPLQMRMFIREYKNGWYSPASFVTSQTLVELPLDMIGPIITVLIAYPLCHQPESAYYWREIGCAIALILASVVVKSQAHIISAFLMDSIENSVFMSCVILTVPALLSGIPLRVSQMMAPIQWISYGSVMRYSFESMLALRYGYEMCPCDPELVRGYPISASASVVPPQLERLSRGLLEINQPTQNETAIGVSNQTSSMLQDENGQDVNLFLRYIRLVSDASNLFAPNPEQLGDCKRYRSLLLMDHGVPDYIVPQWFAIMLAMFVVFRFLTYFSVKTVIKLRRDVS